MVRREIAHKPDLASVTDHPNSRAFFWGETHPERSAARNRWQQNEFTLESDASQRCNLLRAHNVGIC
jgi:hypothetical protein